MDSLKPIIQIVLGLVALTALYGAYQSSFGAGAAIGGLDSSVALAAAVYTLGGFSCAKK